MSERHAFGRFTFQWKLEATDVQLEMRRIGLSPFRGYSRQMP
jgi:hypothetical protein